MKILKSITILLLILLFIVVIMILINKNENDSFNINNISTTMNNEEINNKEWNKVQLQIGESRSLSSSNISIKFIDVLNDDRCPSGVECFHSGFASVKFELNNKGNTIPFELNLRGGNKDVYMPQETKSAKTGSGNVTSVDNYSFYLAMLSPYPEASQSTVDKSKYAVTLFVKKNIPK